MSWWEILFWCVFGAFLLGILLFAFYMVGYAMVQMGQLSP